MSSLGRKADIRDSGQCFLFPESAKRTFRSESQSPRLSTTPGEVHGGFKTVRENGVKPLLIVNEFELRLPVALPILCGYQLDSVDLIEA